MTDFPTTISCRGEQLRIEIDPFEDSDRGKTVHLAIRVEFKGTSQSLQWNEKSLWVTYAELNEFEDALRHGREAMLADPGNRPVIQIIQNGDNAWLRLNPSRNRGTADGERLFVELNAEREFVTNLARAFREFPKWW